MSTKGEVKLAMETSPTGNLDREVVLGRKQAEQYSFSVSYDYIHILTRRDPHSVFFRSCSNDPSIRTDSI